MKNLKEELNVKMGELLDRVEYEQLESEDRIAEMTKIDDFIEHLFELASELQRDYDELDRLEKEYQERRKDLKAKVFRARNIFANKKQSDDDLDRLLEMSYEISDKMNRLRAKARRDAIEEQALAEYQRQLDEINKYLENK